MEYIVKICFPKAKRVTDKSHVYKLVYDVVQEMRDKYRLEVFDKETIEMAYAKACGQSFPIEPKRRLVTNSSAQTYKSKKPFSKRKRASVYEQKKRLC